MRYAFLLVLAALLIAGCASTSATMLGNAPDDLVQKSPSEVTVYSDTASVGCGYTKVAYLSTSGSVSGMDKKMMESAKKKAAEIGANAVVIGRVNSQGPSFGDAYGNTEARYLAVLEDRPCKE